MSSYAIKSGSDGALHLAQQLFENELLPFPPFPESLAASLQQRASGWFATKPMQVSPYFLNHFLAEVEAQPDLPDYAIVGFDGHGTNSWAMHYYFVGKGIALFIQLPWGGAYLEPEPARTDISAMFDWAANLQSKLELAISLCKIPDRVRLEVAASSFGQAGWRWLDESRNTAEIPWNSPIGMKDAILREIDKLMVPNE